MVINNGLTTGKELSKEIKKCPLCFQIDSNHLIRPKNDIDREKKECDRNPFQIDRDRILYSKSFRRLMHKTQVSFIGDMNEHIRTRLTHTLEVSQISRTIARCIGANEDLTEAIALGHDVGHTPFGHVGEFFLFDLLNMSASNDFSPEKQIFSKYQVDITSKNIGFKHNYQSVRVLKELESGYTFNEGKGLNISYPVLEGIIKHSSIYYPKNKKNLVQYENITNDKYFFLNQNFSCSLEGQIVNLADEIAQKCHDIEDAIEGNYDTKNDLINYLTGHLPNHLQLKMIQYKYFYPEKNIIPPHYIKGYISVILSHIVEESVKIIKKKIILYCNKKGLDGSIDPYPIEEDLATESILSKNEVYLLLDNIQKIFIINSYKADREEEKARYILRQIVKAYLSNPKQVRDFIMERYNPIFLEKNYVNGHWVSEVEKIIEDFKKLKLPDEKFSLRNSNSQVIKEHRNIIISDPVFIRLLCDYIASMTDLFAFDEFKKLFLEKPVF